MRLTSALVLSLLVSSLAACAGNAPAAQEPKPAAPPAPPPLSRDQTADHVAAQPANEL